MHATTAGVGDLIAEALDARATRVVLGLGGSATTDGGWGAVQVLESYAPLAGPDAWYSVVVAHDVFTSFTAAVPVFGPQKGASADQVRILTRRLEELQERTWLGTALIFPTCRVRAQPVGWPVDS